ncbi:histidine kinase [Candidatus Marinamargulisbacteria bacterium SCGC AG-343-D04]|nr:histidine kinase [Candidatus Marinamargulisbacteria bacterium SCGC AG-343-D04]
MIKKNEVLLTIPCLPEYVGVARLAVSGVASRMNFSIDEIEDIKVSISEACTNVIQHAYEHTPTENEIIDIKISITNDNLDIVVKDYGMGFDISVLGSPEQKEKSKEKLGLGLGLTFIENLMDNTNFQSEIGKGTTIQMAKTSPSLSH